MALRDQKDVLIAWINGEDMQVKINNEWHDCGKLNDLESVNIGSHYAYRIKPKEIVTTTHIERDVRNEGFHVTYSTDIKTHNLRLTWSEDGKTLLKAEVI